MYTFPFVPFRYGKTATIGALIIVLCLIPSSKFNQIEVPVTYTDLIIHFTMFFVFSGALCLDLNRKRKPSLKLNTIVLISLVVSILLAAVTELLQFYITPLNRSGSLSDLLFDLLGSLSGMAVFLLIKRKFVPEP
jgi:VanZ family protein